MFGEKVYPKPKKAKRQHSNAFYIIGLFTFAIESMLGINASFLVHASMSIVAQNMLVGTVLEPLAFLIALIIALAFGVALIAGGMWTFSGFLEALEDARAYQRTYKTKWGWAEILVWALAVAIILIDVTTLLFRASYFAEKGALALLAFFIVLIFLPPILGMLLHVLENTPRNRRLTKARQYGEQLETDQQFQVVEEMEPDLLSRYLGENKEDAAAALQEHYERVNQQREAAYDYEQQQMREREQVDRPLITVPMPKLFQRPKHLAALPQQAQQSGDQNNQRRA